MFIHKYKVTTSLLAKVRQIILDLVFPVRCISCGKFDSWLCEKCVSEITLKEQQLCPRCESVFTPAGKTCFECRQNFPLDGLIVTCDYSHEVLSKAIHFYKYRFIDDLAYQLGKMISKTISSSEIPLPDIIIPVPLHNSRLRWRGFNQSELLARYVSDNIAPGITFPVENRLLIRSRKTLPQMNIGGHERRKKNIRGAFSVADKKAVKGKTIMLIDDVATTGSTLFECARILKDTGAREVYASVIARQNLKKRSA